MKYQKIDSSYVWKKKYLKRFIAGMIGFGFMMPFVIFIGKKVEANVGIHALIALLPVIPFILAMSAFLQNIKTMDEFWKKIMSEALIYTAIITMTASFAFGMLQVMNVVESFSIFYIFPFMMMLWTFCFAYFHIKYNGLSEHEE
jgi:hypothetical protein